jgi:hypothetical protein
MKKLIFLPAIALLWIGCSRAPSAQDSAQQAQQQAQQQANSQPAPAPPPIDIPSGTPIQVRLDRELDTRRNRAGDRFTATLVTPIVENNQVVVAQGTLFNGHVTNARPSGRLKGRATLGVTLDSFDVNGTEYPLVTTAAGRASARHRKRNLVLIGGGAGTGALIGGVAAGPEGMAIGAGAGAGAGLVGAVFSGRKQVSLPAETQLTFRLEEGVEL